ncbi:thiamine phosphate synthase [Fictibacillus aquaticus]|uniref:Thiamine-phosphate synthase n=1 Tax=Fictibacillus aquaticus TaxID=2021314 RepID=A0A235FE30_9BACL|nr:thiamine phosphate synthase [Fictibacillus aquaticus]OYD59233.1 thiamine phosphate synthase [Fictibacillus aquaticus]
MKQSDIIQALRLYVIAGTLNCKNGRSIEETVERALQGGATMVQFREKGHGSLTGSDKLQCAIRLKSLCAAYRVPFIINDDAELMLLSDADGLHIGQDDGDIAEARKRIGVNKILGVSVYTVAEAKHALQNGADYLGIGPVYETSTKEDAKQAAGIVRIQLIREHVQNIPIVGIGGINEDRAGEVIKAGADGVAVITAVTDAGRPLAAARRLSEKAGSACSTNGR